MRPFFTLVHAIVLWLCLGCTSLASAYAEEALFNLHTKQGIALQDLLQAINQADVTVLGEIHDNPHHHVVRGEWLAMLSRTNSVVAEHLTAPHGVIWQHGLLPDLQATGFDDKGWQWPVHQPLFARIQALGWPVWGGNLSKEDSKSIFKTKGESASPGLKALLASAALDAVSQQDLRREIDEGHCGALPAQMFEGMVAVQRARDASMAQVAMQHRPAVVLAGNGHAWKHLGVPQIIRANRPDLNVVSVLMMEHAPFADDLEKNAWLDGLAGKADVVWVGSPISRPDPCLSFKTEK